MEFLPKKEAKILPRAVELNGSWIGIGGSILRTPEPPELPYTLPEATPEQYEQLYNMGYTSLIEEVKPKKKG